MGQANRRRTRPLREMQVALLERPCRETENGEAAEGQEEDGQK